MTAIVLAEFGKDAPDVSQFRRCWPYAKIHVFRDSDVPRVPEFEGPRYGWRMNDYVTIQKAHELLLSGEAETVLCFDADMRIVDDCAVQELVQFAKIFGVALPLNPRYTVRRDFVDGADVRLDDEPKLWHGPSLNCSPVALSYSGKRGDGARALVEAYLRQMLAAPERGPMCWWRAMEATGVAPLILPPQWCICNRHIGVGGEIVLHEGHEDVKRYYAGRL